MGPGWRAGRQAGRAGARRGCRAAADGALCLWRAGCCRLGPHRTCARPAEPEDPLRQYAHQRGGTCSDGACTAAAAWGGAIGQLSVAAGADPSDASGSSRRWASCSRAAHALSCPRTLEAAIKRVHEVALVRRHDLCMTGAGGKGGRRLCHGCMQSQRMQRARRAAQQDHPPAQDRHSPANTGLLQAGAGQALSRAKTSSTAA